MVVSHGSSPCPVFRLLGRHACSLQYRRIPKSAAIFATCCIASLRGSPRCGPMTVMLVILPILSQPR